MNPNTPGRRPRSLVALLLALLTILTISQPIAAGAAEIAPNLVSLDRTSADIVQHGDEVVIAWEFDAPVDSVSVILRDGLGGQQYLYGGWEAATSGETRGIVDTTVWPGGAAAFDGLSYSWTSGETSHWVELDADGEVRWASDGLETIPPAGAAIGTVGFDVQSDVDLSTPPALQRVTRTSGDVVVDGEQLVIEWEFDRAVDSVAFQVRDSLGRTHRAEWRSWLSGTGPSTAGTAAVAIDTPLWSGGEVVFDGLDYAWNGGSMSLDATGTVWSKQPQGIADATLPPGVSDSLRFIVDSEFDPTAVPLLTSLTRTSADIVREGDEIVVEWAFDAPVDDVHVVLRDSLGGQHRLWGWTFGPAQAGDARTVVDTSGWPSGEVVLDHITYSWGSRSVTLDANGDVAWASEGVSEIPSAAEAISVPAFQVESDVDLSLPPALSSVTRASPDVLTDGEELQVAWAFDRPVDSLHLRFRDSLGVRHYVYWSMWQEGTGPASEGIARAQIDANAWSGGAIVFDGIEYSWGNSSISFDAAGEVEHRYPSGLQTVPLPMAELSALEFVVESDVDLTAVPSVVSAGLVSGPVLRDGEAPAIAWETDAPVQWMAFRYFDGLGREQQVTWSGEPATTGVAAEQFEGASWAPGVAELAGVAYSMPGGDRSIGLARDGSVSSKRPAGLDDPIPYAPGFTALDFTVETDAVFETVTVPSPVFTDATCDAPADLLLEDFDHGSWSWYPGGGGYGGGGESHDGEPGGMVVGQTYTVTAHFEDGWGTTGESQWTHRYADPGSCEPLLEFSSAPVPAISGDPVVGSTLAVAAGAWEPRPVELSIQWLRDGVPVVGATAPTYDLTAADADAVVTVEVTGAKDGYATTVRSSDPVNVTEPAPVADPVTRVSGEGRSGRAVAVSAAGWEPGVEVAFVVNGTDQTSAIAGAALAGASGGPLLPVRAASIPADVQAELERLAPARIVVLGDARSVGDAVADELGEYTDGSVDRVAGEGPFGMSAAISAAGWPAGVEVAFVVDAADEASAHPGAALAATADGPLLAVRESSVPEEIAAELERLEPERIVVLGGTDAIGDSVMTRLDAFTDGSVTRVSGDRRFGMSAAVAESGWSSGAEVVFVANASDDASAVAGAALAGSSGAPVLSVKDTSIPSEIRAELDRLDPKRIVVLGGTDAVGVAVFTELAAFVVR
ncbi:MULTISPECIES: cell wall-binding repeat-containing protein [unclassified Agromyces]|uniref:cell wall-binding repeat-containing protein n=1 Tax=unclassified Agromyces TaxID=2639701 RepID=UPI003014436D